MNTTKASALPPLTPMAAAVWAALFLPSRAGGLDLEGVFAGAAALAALWALAFEPSPWEARRPSRQAAVFFVLVAFLFLISLLYAMAFNGVESGPRDLAVLGRPLLFGLLAVWTIRHFDARGRAALDAGLAAAPWIFLAALASSIPLASPSFILFASAAALCRLMFFSAAPARLVHAAAALSAAIWSAAAVPWVAPSRASDALAFIRRSPFFGWGPSSYELLPEPDNQYLYWILKHGALGTAVILLGLAFVAYRLLRATWGEPARRLGAVFSLAAFVLLLADGRFMESPRLFLLAACVAAGMAVPR